VKPGAHPLIHFAGLAMDERLHLTDPDGLPIAVPIHPLWCLNHWRPLAEALLAERRIGALQVAVCGREIAEGNLVCVQTSCDFSRMDGDAIYPPGPRPAARTKAFLTLLGEPAGVLLDQDTEALPMTHGQA
jgi:hypothetical protein